MFHVFRFFSGQKLVKIRFFYKLKKRWRIYAPLVVKLLMTLTLFTLMAIICIHAIICISINDIIHINRLGVIWDFA
jgi:hypothetical protein